MLCNSLYENNAGYSTDSLTSTWSLEGSVKSETSSGGEEMYDDADSQDVDGVFDTLIYIGNSNICCGKHCLILPFWDHGVYRHFQQYFSNIMVVSFIGGRNWTNRNLLWKDSLNIDGQQFHWYQQFLTSNNLTPIKTTTYGIGNPGPGLGQA